MYGYVVCGVCLGVEENFGVVDVVGKCVCYVCCCYVVEILFGEQYVGVGVIQVEE